MISQITENSKPAHHQAPLMDRVIQDLGLKLV